MEKPLYLLQFLSQDSKDKQLKIYRTTSTLKPVLWLLPEVPQKQNWAAKLHLTERGYGLAQHGPLPVESLTDFGAVVYIFWISIPGDGLARGCGQVVNDWVFIAGIAWSSGHYGPAWSLWPPWSSWPGLVLRTDNISQWIYRLVQAHVLV